MKKVTDHLDLLKTDDCPESEFTSQNITPYNTKHAATNHFRLAGEISKIKSNFVTLRTEMNAKIDRLVVSSIDQN